MIFQIQKKLIQFLCQQFVQGPFLPYADNYDMQLLPQSGGRT